MNRTLGVTLALGWIVLFLLQAFAAPFDGYVPAHVTADGASDLWSRIAGALGAAPHAAGEEHPASVPYAIALVVVSLFSAWAAWRMIGRAAAGAEPRPDPRAAAHAGRRSNRFLFALTLALACGGLLGLTRLSNDLYLYRAQGLMMSRAHLNPYAHAATECLPAADLGNVPWEDKRSAYGPLALWLFRAGVLPGGGAVIPDFWTLKLLMSLPVIALLAGIAFTRRIDEGERAALLAWFGLNPLLILEVHQNGHLEGWMGLLLAGALLVASRPGTRRAVLAGMLIAVATAIKISALVVLGATACQVARSASAGTRGRASLTRAGVIAGLAHGFAFAATLAVFYSPFWIGPATFRGVSDVATDTLRSIHFVLLTLGLNPSSVNELGVAGTIAAIAAGAWIAWRRGRLTEAMMAAIGLHAVLGRNFLQPWYVAPIVFVAAPGVVAWVRVSAADAGRAAVDSACAKTHATLAVSPRALLFTLAWSAWAVAGAYAPFYVRSTLSPAWQTFSLALMLLPPFAFLVRRPRAPATADVVRGSRI